MALKILAAATAYSIWMTQEDMIADLEDYRNVTITLQPGIDYARLENGIEVNADQAPEPIYQQVEPGEVILISMPRMCLSCQLVYIEPETDKVYTGVAIWAYYFDFLGTLFEIDPEGLAEFLETLSEDPLCVNEAFAFLVPEDQEPQ